MNLAAALSAFDPRARLARALARPRAALEALPTRERMLVAMALLALAVGGELMLVQPQRDKRVAIEAALHTSAADRLAAQTQAEQQLRERDDDLQRRRASVDAALARDGVAAAPRESLGFLLSRTLQSLPVRVLALNALASEELSLRGESAEAASAEPAPSTPPLFRHRYELRVAGEPAQLIAAVQALDSAARPLRIERVKLVGDAHGQVQAHVTLMILGAQRTWLAL